MQIVEIPASQCEFLKQLLLENQWQMTHQDAGQTHLVGWGYEIHWALGSQKIILRYSDKQGIAMALLEFSDSAKHQVSDLLTQINDANNE